MALVSGTLINQCFGYRPEQDARESDEAHRAESSVERFIDAVALMTSSTGGRLLNLVHGYKKARLRAWDVYDNVDYAVRHDPSDSHL